MKLYQFFPGLGFSSVFSGLILQLVHDLNIKNVYTVNPESVFRCGLSREDGLFVMGAVLVQKKI